MNRRVYNVSELRKLIRESSNEFKPVTGKNVEKDNKKNNEEAYKNATKRSKDYDGGVGKKSKQLSDYPDTMNRGMQDIMYDNKLTAKQKADMNAQAKGWLNAEDEKKHKNDESPVEHNEIPGMKERAKKFKKNRETQTTIGLTGRELDPNQVEELRDTMFENRAPKYKFKRTGFLNEDHMLSLIPDEAKVENRKCIMEDARGTQYYVIWHNDMPEYINKTRVNEDVNKIRSLMGFKPQNLQTTGTVRINENKAVEDIMNKVRQLMK